MFVELPGGIHLDLADSDLIGGHGVVSCPSQNVFKGQSAQNLHRFFTGKSVIFRAA